MHFRAIWSLRTGQSKLERYMTLNCQIAIKAMFYLLNKEVYILAKNHVSIWDYWHEMSAAINIASPFQQVPWLHAVRSVPVATYIHQAIIVSEFVCVLNKNIIPYFNVTSPGH